MTALESLVVFGLAATGLLGSLQATARSVEDADAWVRAVAEAAMAASKLGAAPPPLPLRAEGLENSYGVSLSASFGRARR